MARFLASTSEPETTASPPTVTSQLTARPNAASCQGSYTGFNQRLSFARFSGRFLTIALGLILSLPLNAAERKWNGNGGNDNWRNDDNWRDKKKPDSDDTVFFPSGEGKTNIDLKDGNGNREERAIGIFDLATDGTDTTNSDGTTVDWNFRRGALKPLEVRWASSASGNILRLDTEIETQNNSTSITFSGGSGSQNLHFYGDIAEPGTFTLNAPSDGLYLFRANSTPGSFQITNGTLFLRHNNAIANATLNITGSNALNYTGYSPSVKNLSGSGSFSLVNGQNLTFGSNNGNETFSGTISGNASYLTNQPTKTGSGTWTVQGDNTFGARFAINGGTVRLTDSGSLRNALVDIQSGSTLDIDTATNVGNLNGSGLLQVDQDLTLRSSGLISSTFSGTVNGNADIFHSPGSNTSITFNGSGSAGNYNGTIHTAENGSRIIYSSDQMGAPTFNVRSDNSLQIGGSGTRTAARIYGAGNVTLNANLKLIESSRSSYGGVFSGPGGLILSHREIFFLTKDQLFSGETRIEGRVDLLVANGIHLVGEASLKNSPVIFANDGLLFINTDAPTSIGNLSGATGIVFLSQDLTIRGEGPVSTRFSGQFNGSGDLTHTGISFLDLSEARIGPFPNSFRGDVTTSADGGVLVIANHDSGLFERSVFTIRGDDSLLLIDEATIGALAGSGNLKLDHDLNLERTTHTTYSGDLSKNGKLTKNGNGTFTFNGTKSGSGEVKINEGALGGNGTISGNTTIASDAALAPGDSVGAMTFQNDLSLQGTLELEFDDTGNDQITVQGTLNLSGAELNLSGLDGANLQSTYVLASYGTLSGNSFSSITGIPAGYEIFYTAPGNQITLSKSLNLTSIAPVEGESQPTFDFQFSEAVTGFNASDLVISAPGLTGTPVALISGSGSTRRVVITGLTGTGDVSVSLASDATIITGSGLPLNAPSTRQDSEVVFTGFYGNPANPISQQTVSADLLGAEFLVVAVGGYVPEGSFLPSEPSLTFGGIPMEEKITSLSENHLVSIFYLPNPPAGLQSLVVDLPARNDEPYFGGIMVLGLNEVDLSDPFTRTLNNQSGPPVFPDVEAGSIVLQLNSTDILTSPLAVNGQSNFPSLTQVGSDTYHSASIIEVENTETLDFIFQGLGVVSSLRRAPVSATALLDTVSPTITSFAWADDVEDVTNATSVSLNITFSEPVSDLLDTDFLIESDASVTSRNLSFPSSPNEAVLTLNNIVGSGPLSIRLPSGSYRDSVGNPGMASETLSLVVDQEAPVIEFNGPGLITLDFGAAWVDPVTVSDNLDVAPALSTTGDVVDTMIPGQYSLNYKATDEAGNQAIGGTRVVVVRNQIETWTDSFTLVEEDATSGADPDNDGRINLEEFAFDDDPSSGTSSQKTRLSQVSHQGTEYLSLTIPVRNGASFTGSPSLTTTVDGIVYTIEGSTDLNSYDKIVQIGASVDSAALPALSSGWEYRSFWVEANNTASSFIRVFVSSATP